MHSDYRHDPFANTSTAVIIPDEVQMVPLSSPYMIRLNEVPLKENPTSVSARVRDILGAAVSTTDGTSITATNGSWFASNDVITIDNEQMQVTNVSGSTLTVTRGYNSTTAATHDLGKPIYGPAWAEVAAAPAAKQYWPDYATGADSDDNWNTGLLLCNSADAGKVLSISYKGTGTLASVSPAKSWPACFFEMGDGSDGHFVSSGSDTIDGLKQYKSFTILPGHTVTVGENPLILLVQGAVVIAGTLNGDGDQGGSSNSTTAIGGSGKGGGGKGADTDGTAADPASGAGGGAGGTYPGATGNLLGKLIKAAATVPAALCEIASRMVFVPSSGAGGGAGNLLRGGGAGGGSIVLIAKAILNTGTLVVDGGLVGDGGAAGYSGAGGGGGASIRIVAAAIKFTGTISVRGGKGGTGNSSGAAQSGASGWSAVYATGG